MSDAEFDAFMHRVRMDRLDRARRAEDDRRRIDARVSAAAVADFTICANVAVADDMARDPRARDHVRSRLAREIADGLVKRRAAMIEDITSERDRRRFERVFRLEVIALTRAELAGAIERAMLAGEREGHVRANERFAESLRWLP